MLGIDVNTSSDLLGLYFILATAACVVAVASCVAAATSVCHVAVTATRVAAASSVHNVTVTAAISACTAVTAVCVVVAFLLRLLPLTAGFKATCPTAFRANPEIKRLAF